MITKSIDEVSETLIDYRGKTPKKTDNGIKLITAKVIKDGFIIDGNHEYISEEEYDKWMTRGLPKQWDILITTEAPLGEVARLRTPEKVALAQRVILLRGNPNIIDQTYYFYALRSPYVQNGLMQRATGTTVLGIKQSELRQVKIPYHPLPTQRNIAAILSAYDDLIENNTHRIKILEEMAQLIYREWFVKFRFPGHEKVRMVDSVLGPIPEGWEVVKLGEIIEFQKGKKAKNVIEEQCDGFIPYLLIDGLKNYHYVYTDDKKILVAYETDCIMVMDGASSGYVSIGHYGAVGSTLAKITIKGNLNSYYLYQFLQVNYKIISDNNTGSAIPHTNKDFVNGMFIPIPPISLMRIYIDCVEPIFRLTWKLRKKNTILHRTRDLLLPRLISGELDVENLDIDVGGD
ncbi:MAG: restriction endonuclease subunit S [Firmicutes bacterium]|nr:restriction endonuclease subunit S [Bacillota bacterium]